MISFSDNRPFDSFQTYLPIAAIVILAVVVGVVVTISSEYLWLVMMPIGTIAIFAKPDLSPFALLAVFPISFGIQQNLAVSKFVFVGLFLVTYGVWLFNRKTPAYRVPFSAIPLVKPMITLGVLLAISLVVALFSGTSPIDWLRDASSYANYLLILPVAGLLRSKRHIRWTAVLLIVVSFFISLATISAGRFFSGGTGRLPFSASVGWTLAVIVIGVALLIAPKKNGLATAHWFIKLCLGAVIVTALMGLVSTGYRSALAGLAVGIAVLSLLGLRRKRSLWMQIAVLLILGLLVLYPILSLHVIDIDYFLSRTLPAFIGQESLTQDLSWIARRNEIISGIDIFRSAPILGHGFGYHFYRVLYGNVFRDNFFFHNTYVGILAKTGVVGAIVILWMFYRLLNTLLSVWRTENGQIGWLCLGLAAALIGAGFFSYFDTALDNNTFSFMMSFSIAVALRWKAQGSLTENLGSHA